MTTQEMVYIFQIKLEIIDERFRIKERPDTDTILVYLNMAQEKYFNDKYLNKGSMKDTANYLKNIASDELVKLIQTTGLVTAASTTYYGHPYAYRYSTTVSQYAHYVDSYLLFARSQPKVITERWTICDLADSAEDLKKIETNAYNEPILRSPVVFLDGSDNLNTAGQIYTYIIVDKYTTAAATNNFNMRYIRKPKSLDFTASSGSTVVESELARHTHEDILALALELFKQDKFALISKE